MQINRKKSTVMFLLFQPKITCLNSFLCLKYFWAESGDRNTVMIQKKTHLKYKDVFFTEDFVGKSNLHTNQTGIFNSLRYPMELVVGVRWKYSHLSHMDKRFL